MTEDPMERVARFLDRGQFSDALQSAKEAVGRVPESARSHYALGLVLTQLDRIPEADRSFARAAELDPEYVLPCRMERSEFESVVEGVLASLPTEFASYLQNVEVAVESAPCRDLLQEADIEHDLLGFYQGNTIQNSEWGLPDRIVLYQRNLENISSDRASLIREVRDTVLHEVGHHLGMEEDQLEEIEKEFDDLDDKGSSS